MSDLQHVDELGLSKSPTEGSVWEGFARSVRDNAVAEIAIQVIRVSTMMILARELAPWNFGIFRVLLIVGTVGILVYDAGIPDSLIRLKNLRRAHEVTAWCISIALAVTSAVMLWSAAPMVASWMRMAQLKNGVRLLSIPILLEGSVVVANARLQRSLRFRILALADLFGEMAFLVVALAVVWRGLPVWSLPAALAARFAAHAIAIWVAEPRPPIGMPAPQPARDLLSFAASVSGGQILYFLSSNADFLLVGRLLGSRALGFYAIAWDLLRFVPDRLHQVAGRVTYPAFCKFQEDNEALARAYTAFFKHIAKIVLPVLSIALVAAPELIFTVYGRQWLPAAQPLRLLAAGLSLAGLRVGIGSLFYCKGYPSIDIYLHTFRLVLILIVVSCNARYGLIAVSAAMSAVEALVSIVGIWCACYLIDLRPFRLVEAALPGIGLASVCAVCAIVVRRLASGAGLDRPEILLIVATTCLLTYGILEAQTLTRMLSMAFNSASIESLDS